MSRKALKDFIPTDKPVLEIGPFRNPFLKKSEYDVYYADIRDENAVSELYKGRVSVDALVHIDYVIKRTYRDAVGKKSFGAVFSSHVIEHTADIIGHLQETAEILEAGGMYCLCVPDRRFTFDHFRETTPFSAAYAVHAKGESLWRLAFDFFSHVNDGISNLPAEYIMNIPSFGQCALDDKNISRAFEQADNWQNIIGGFHTWVFTYVGFLAFLRDCARFAVLPFTLKYACPPAIGANEFTIVLEKNANMLDNAELRRAEIVKLNERIEKPQGVLDLRNFFDKSSKIYFYGAAYRARYVLDHIGFEYANKAAGLVCSDDFPKEDFPLPVFHLSELLFLTAGDIVRGSVGIVCVLSEVAKSEVIPKLQELGFDNIFEQPYID
jgi:SAM-dependent methyltransferase